MRRTGKVLGWVIAFSACFAVGAVIAAHSDPFPPGVIDPGAASTGTGTSPTPAEHALDGSLRLQTVHTLYVGGACRTNWKGTLALQQAPDGSITGTGTIDLLGDLHCDFAVIQAQSQAVNVDATGSVKGNVVRVTLTVTGKDPKASNDFGGLTHTVEFLTLSARLDGTQRVHVIRPDEDRGSYSASGTFAVSCASGCE